MRGLPLSVTGACALAATFGAAPGAAPAQLLVRQQVMVRVTRPAAAAVPQRPVRWAEKKGPKCVAIDSFAGALIAEPDAVDLVLEGGARMRARLDDDCPSLDFYRGFYFRPTADGRVCAGRDALRSRSGRMCAIAGFKRLVAKR